jgi:hypothetical protein
MEQFLSGTADCNLMNFPTVNPHFKLAVLLTALQTVARSRQLCRR